MVALRTVESARGGMRTQYCARTRENTLVLSLKLNFFYYKNTPLYIVATVVVAN